MTKAELTLRDLDDDEVDACAGGVPSDGRLIFARGYIWSYSGSPDSTTEDVVVDSEV